MIKVMKMSEDLRLEILKFLYFNEQLNVFMIHYFENQMEELGDVYIGRDNDEISSIVHIKNDGNSNFTSFYVKNDHYLNDVAQLLKTKLNQRILLAGEVDKVKVILSLIGCASEVNLNSYYVLCSNKYSDDKMISRYSFRKVDSVEDDIEKVKAMIIKFFGAETEADIDRITSDEKLRAELNAGIYLLEIDGVTVGMARYSGCSKNYIDITTLYIEESQRGRGYGKLLTQLMTENALEMDKLPILQTSKDNISANRIYEQLGYVSAVDYTFHFL